MAHSKNNDALTPHNAHHRATTPSDIRGVKPPPRARDGSARPQPKTPFPPPTARDPRDQHIDALLSALADRRTPPSEEEIDALATQMASHLLTCEECQQTLSAIIQRLAEQSGEDSAERERGTLLLDRFNSVLTKARARKRLGAYVLMCCTKGEAAAAETYPDVAEHLVTCEKCREDVAARIPRREQQFKTQEHADPSQ